MKKINVGDIEFEIKEDSKIIGIITEDKYIYDFIVKMDNIL